MFRKQRTDPFTSSVASGSNAIVLATGQQIDFGSGNFDYLVGDGTFVRSGTTFFAPQFGGSNGSRFQVLSYDGDDALALGLEVDTNTAFTTSGGKLLSLKNATVEKAYVDKDGGFSANNYGCPLGNSALTQGLAPSGSNLYLNGPAGFLIGMRNNSGLQYADFSATGMDMSANTAAKLKLANTVVGTATLVGGTVTVSTAAVKTGDLIFTSRNTTGGTAGHLNAPVASIVNSTSFVINSSSGTDTSTVNWWIVDN